MRFSFAWLTEYVDCGVDAEAAAARLTGAGLAVEALEPVGGDVILEVDVTTNRPDCMCHFGLARELAALLGRPLQPPAAEAAAEDIVGSRAPGVRVDDEIGCPRYVARIVRGVTVAPSPDWLVQRLQSIGQRTINNVVDITNYVLWELGQPIHAFDLGTLAEQRIVVRRAGEGEQLTTLDGEDRRLDAEILVIADAERAVALAGIMGGLHTEVTEATVDVLIESAHFLPARVRHGAGRLGLHTDASHRFERGSDPEVCRLAADRVATLIVEVAGGRLDEEAADVRDRALDWRLEGRLELERAVRFGGVDLDAGQLEAWLTGVGFELAAESEGVWRVGVPSWRYYDLRPDPTAPPGQAQGPVFEADLFEEVLRLHGFDAIPATLPEVGGPDEGSSAGHQRREAIRRHLAACGYLEAITFAFHEAAAESRYPAMLRTGEPLRLANPLSELFAVMRRSLLPGLVSAAEYSQRRGLGAVRLFEIGHVFPGTEAAELEGVALVAGGGIGSPWNRHAAYDFFDLKGVVESLARRFGVGLRFRAADIGGLMEGSSATILAAGTEEVVGYIGRLAQPEAAQPLYVAELQARILEPAGARTIRLPSRFPGIEVDLTLTHALDTAWGEIAREIERAKVADLIEFGLKDRYLGAGIPEGAVNTTVYFLYNADDRSLRQEEVNQRHEALRRHLEERFAWRQSTR